MTGVEILAANEVVSAYAFNWHVYILMCTASTFVMSLVVGFGCYFDIGGWSFVYGAIFGLLFGALIGILPAKETLPSEYVMEYKVTISDEVSMNDFLARYEIVDQEGKIYTVREREGETE